MFRPSQSLPHPDLPPASISVQSSSAPCGLCVSAFNSLSARPCRGGSSDPRFFPTLSASPSLFPLFCKKSAKLSPYFSCPYTLFKKEYFANPFPFNSFRTLLQNTGGVQLRPRNRSLLLSIFAVRNPSIASIPFRIISFADHSTLTPIESHLYRKCRGGEALVFSPFPKRTRNIQVLPLWMRSFADARREKEDMLCQSAWKVK